jgi:DNA mismatch repair ATPase MutL
MRWWLLRAPLFGSAPLTRNIADINGRFVNQTPLHELLNKLHRQCVEPSSTRREKSYPFYVLQLQCPPTWYDVSYDPDKTICEFKDWHVICSSIKRKMLEFLGLPLEGSLESPQPSRAPSPKPPSDSTTTTTTTSTIIPPRFQATYYLPRIASSATTTASTSTPRVGMDFQQPTRVSCRKRPASPSSQSPKKRRALSSTFETPTSQRSNVEALLEV